VSVESRKLIRTHTRTHTHIHTHTWKNGPTNISIPPVHVIIAVIVVTSLYKMSL